MNNLNSNYLDSSVRWTDKVTLCHNGDIVEDFTGKVVGHVDQQMYEKIVKGDITGFSIEGDTANEN